MRVEESNSVRILLCAAVHQTRQSFFILCLVFFLRLFFFSFSRASNIKRRVLCTHIYIYTIRSRKKNSKGWRTRQNSRTNTELKITYHWMTNSIILACRKCFILPSFASRFVVAHFFFSLFGSWCSYFSYIVFVLKMFLKLTAQQ